MTLIDTHCHLTHRRYRQILGGVLRRARQAGVVAVICPAGDLDDARASLDLARRHEEIYFAAGVHPHEAKGAGQDYLGALEALAGECKNVAIGEVGLDYYRDLSPRGVQRRVFGAQLELARRLEKKVIVHTREAFEDALAILRESGVAGPAVEFHSFTEGPTQVRQALDFGAMISFSGTVTYKHLGELREAAKLAPDDRILVETDGPYLAPEPVRKIKTNEPAHVAHVAACLAAVRNTTPGRVAELTTANARRFFGLAEPL